jgi:hypothetical protein
LEEEHDGENGDEGNPKTMKTTLRKMFISSAMTVSPLLMSLSHRQKEEIHHNR